MSQIFMPPQSSHSSHSSHGHRRKYPSTPYQVRHHQQVDDYDHRYAVKHDFRQFIETEDEGDDDYLLDRGHHVQHQDDEDYEDPPQIHELLAASITPIVFDIRASAYKQLRAQANAPYEPHFDMAATPTSAATIRIISKEFPWSFDIKSGSGGPVSVKELLEGIYIGLQGRLTDTEWVGADEVKKRSIEKANMIRRDKGTVSRLKRVDWLGARIYFAGLVHDAAFVKRCLAPGRDSCPETWIVRFQG